MDFNVGVWNGTRIADEHVYHCVNEMINFMAFFSVLVSIPITFSVCVCVRCVTDVFPLVDIARLRLISLETRIVFICEWQNISYFYLWDRCSYSYSGSVLETHLDFKIREQKRQKQNEKKKTISHRIGFYGPI